MEHLSLQNIICTESLQQDNDSQDALDKVVDPCTEFQLQVENFTATPREAFNLTEQPKKFSSTVKLNYKVNENELPRVHNFSKNKIATTMLKKDKNIIDKSEEKYLDDSQDLSIISDCSSLLYPYNPRDKVETASNISLNSNLTIPGSNISSTSDLTGYEEEFYQIKKLVNHGSSQSLYQPEVINASKNSATYEHKIEELEIQLQETLTENEKYKFDLKDLENKVELVWQEKYQEALRQKAQCEGQLEQIREQYEKEKEKTLNIYKPSQESDLKSEFTKLQQKLNKSEKHNSDLQSKLILAFNESKQYQTEFLKTESENEKLRISLQEMKSEIDSKNNVLSGLKNKITEQHIELQNEIHAKLKLNNQIASLNNDIESVKKSEKWYKDQLHSCQLIKNNIQQELMSSQMNLIASNQKIDNMRVEITYWKNLCDEIQRKAMKEKENLLRKVEIIEADILEREAILKCTQTENDTKIEMNYVGQKSNDAKEYQIIAEDYEEQIKNMKKILQDQNSSIENFKKQNTEYLMRLTTLQKNYNEKELDSQTLRNYNKDLEMQCNSYNEAIRNKCNEILELKNKIVNLEVAFHATNREKQEIDDVVKNLRDDLSKFVKSYQCLKEKLEEKTKIITQYEQEKQESFMENNWRVCKIEHLQQKILNGKELQAEIIELKNMNNQIMIEKEELKQEIQNLKIQLNGNNKNYSNYENEILKLNEVLQIRENQLINQTKNCELLNNDIDQNQKQINELQRKLSTSINNLEKENNLFQEKEQCNLELQKKVEELSKKLINAEQIIEHFNILCRKSETEKHQLSNHLNLIQKKLENNQTNATKSTNCFTQTDLENNSELLFIKSQLLELFSENCATNNHKTTTSTSDIIANTKKNINYILQLTKDQKHELENSECKNKILRKKLLKLKNNIKPMIKHLSDKCSKLEKNYEYIEYIINNKIKMPLNLNSVESQTDFDPKNDYYLQEIKDLKTLLRVNEMQRKEHYKRYEISNRTLLKKVKEHMRGRKIVENKLSSLEETYSLAITEINNLKIINNRLEVELNTIKNRCDEYKLICDKLNDDIVKLEKENSQKSAIVPSDCLNCLNNELKNNQLQELEYKCKALEDKLLWQNKEMDDKDKGIIECKKQLFNEKLQTSALKKQISSVQMCLDNANEQLDKKKLELTQLKAVLEKVENNEKILTGRLESADMQYQDYKRKLESALRLVDEKDVNEEILADEMKNLTCVLHQKNLEINELKNKYSILESQTTTIKDNQQKIIDELQVNLTELQSELKSTTNDKFFLQRLCSDLKMSLQATLNQNKVLHIKLETLNEQIEKSSNDSLSNLSFSSQIDEEHINMLLQQSSVVPNKPLKHLRSCLDSLKQEMAVLQKEIITKTQMDRLD